MPGRTGDAAMEDDTTKSAVSGPASPMLRCLVLPQRHHTRGGFGYSPRQAALSRAQRPCHRRASSSWRSCAASAWAAVDACSARSIRAVSFSHLRAQPRDL